MTIFFVAIFTGILYVILLCFAAWSYKVCDKKDAPVGWIFVSIHGILFYFIFSLVYITNDTALVVPWFGGMNLNQVFNYWSIALRTHTILFGISILWAQITRIRGKC